jgi:cell division protein FtsI/penicillin-binding protein 2
VYVIPTKVSGTVSKASLPLRKLLDTYGYATLLPYVDNLFEQQENRYVKILSDANPMLAQTIKELKNTYYQKQSRDKIPLLHGLGLEPTSRRYYQYGSFLSNVL